MIKSRLFLQLHRTRRKVSSKFRRSLKRVNHFFIACHPHLLMYLCNLRYRLQFQGHCNASCRSFWRDWRDRITQHGRFEQDFQNEIHHDLALDEFSFRWERLDEVTGASTEIVLNPALSITRLGPGVQSSYFQGILWITFGLSLIRFSGLLWYLLGEYSEYSIEKNFDSHHWQTFTL